MERVEVFGSHSLYRDDFRIRGYRFGGGEKAMCIVGSMRGNEHQQLYVCGQIVRRLQELEQAHLLDENREILVIPCVNPYSMNIGKRFWTIDNTDINRMFPGYDQGETTQRIAAGVFNCIKDYQYGVQFASFYMKGTFAPHVRMMRTGFEDTDLAQRFGLPYVIVRDPRPFDTTTLNYNWQIWETDAFSIYTTTTETIDPASAREAVESVERFLSYLGLVRKDYEVTPAVPVIRDDDLATVRTTRAGFFDGLVDAGDEVTAGQVIANIYDAYEGNIRERLVAPANGHVLFRHQDSLIYANSAAFKIICS